MFTVNTKGNGALTYPIGLITVDELMLSGMSVDRMNSLSYTFASRTYWTMTPNYYDTISYSTILSLKDYGTPATKWNSVETGVRPVINISASTEISGGMGTANQPFIIK